MPEITAASNEIKKSRGRGRPKLTAKETEEIRTKIISAARILFIEEGYEGVSTRKIASKVPCSKGVLYIHFKNKREILQDIWDDIFLDSFNYCHKAANKQEHTVDKLRAFVTAYVQYWTKHPEHFKMIYLLDKREKEDIDYADHSFSYMKYEWITELIENAINSGELTAKPGITVHEIAESLYSVGQGLSYREVFHGGIYKEKQRVTEVAIDAVLDGLFSS